MIRSCDTDAGQRWLERVLYLTLLLVCAVTLSKNQPDPDFWGHVQYGRDALARGLPEVVSYSYTASGYRWVNHENLSELAFSLGVDTAGPAALLCVKAMLGILLIGAIMRGAMKQRVSQSCMVFSALLVSINLMHFWVLRPQVFSYLFFAFLILILDRAFAGWNGWRLPAWRRVGDSQCESKRDLATARDAIESEAWNASQLRSLWILPPLFLVWANTHGGFVAGYGVLFVYLTIRGFEAIRRYGAAKLGYFAVVLAVTAVATVANPYGTDLHAWLLESLRVPRPEIIEWRAPELTRIAWLPWWLLTASFVASALFSRRRPQLAHFIVTSLILWQAIEHRRHIPFFAILFGFWMVIHLDDLTKRLGAKDGPLISTSGSPILARTVLGSMIGLILLSITVLRPQLTDMPVLRDQYPVSAFQYISNRQLGGKLVTRFMWAQYAIAAFGSASPDDPRIQVAFDGRFRTCYPQHLVDMYFDFALGPHPTEPRHRSEYSGPINDRILEYRDPDLVLVDRRQTNAVGALRGRKEWTLLYQDELAQLWGRTNTYARPESRDYIPPQQRNITDREQTGYIPWPALPASA